MSNPAAAAPRLVDAHAHLCDDGFAGDLGAVLERAQAAGVHRILLVGESLEDAARNLELAGEHAILKPCAGLYPTHLDLEAAAAMAALIRERAAELVGIGEVGLDYWVVQEEDQRRVQREILARFVELSLELDLPLNVHSRSAGRETIAFLIERGARRVLLHAFDGRAAKAEAALEAGFYFSIPPSIVRSRQKQKLVRQLPLDRLLLETDSPVLGPEPKTRNEPANVKIALEAVAEIKGLSAGDVARQTTENAARLFPRAFV